MHVSLALIFLSCATGAASDVPPVLKQYSKVMTFYYTSPEPAVGPKLLKDLLKKENISHSWFQKRQDVLSIIGTQLGHIAKSKPQIVRQYETAFLDTVPLGRKVIINALATCGDDETLKKVAGWIDDAKYSGVSEELKQLKELLSRPKRPRSKVTKPHDLDLLWAEFFVTGEFAPVSHLLDVFDMPDTEANRIMKGAARWSLQSNVRRHPKLMQLVKKQQITRTGASRKTLDEILGDE